MSALLQGLNERQAEAVVTTDGPVLVIAGAGSGKTKTLTHRIAYLVREKGVAPHQLLAMTFTNKAAGEIRERAATLLNQRAQSWMTWRGFGSGPVIGTFHSVCIRILREDGGALGYDRSFVVYDASDQKTAMKRVMKEEGISPKEVNPNTVLGIVSKAKNELIEPDELASSARGPVEKTAAHLYEKYQRFLSQHNAMDFDDLLVNTVRLFREHETVRKKYQDLWRYVMIDEYQDTNHVQYTWVHLLAGDRKNVFVVGDDWQGIYSWRGATIRNILEFEKDFPGARVVRLEQNYRSTNDIVSLGNMIISGNQSQMKKKLWTEKEGSNTPEVWEVSDGAREAELILEKIWEQESGSSVEASPLEDESSDDDEIQYDYAAEGGGILDKIMGGFSTRSDVPASRRKASRQIPFDIASKDIDWNKYAVLYRTNAQSRTIEETLLKHAIPYRIIGGVRFYERKEIKDMIAYIRFLRNEQDIVSLARIINEPARGVGEKTLSQMAAYAGEQGLTLLSCMREAPARRIVPPARAHALGRCAAVFDRTREHLPERTVREVIDLLLVRSGYKDMLKAEGEEGEDRIENIEELKNVAQKFDHLKGAAGIDSFLEEVALVADIDTYRPESGSALTLMTLHSAKGLEFDTVFLAGLEEGLLPHGNSLIDPEQLEEERRLCYVGITRAREQLYLMHARERLLHGSYVSNVPSRFLAELGDEHVRFCSDSTW